MGHDYMQSDEDRGGMSVVAYVAAVVLLLVLAVAGAVVYRVLTLLVAL